MDWGSKVSSAISAAKIRFCVSCVFSCVKNASYGLATGSMDEHLSRVSPAIQSFTAATDF